MAKSVDYTSLLCLFHHQDHAKAALNDLDDAHIPRELVSVLGGENDHAADLSALKQLGVPQRDLKHLEEGLADGGLIVVVRALTEHVADVEAIFAKHRAEKIDEAETASLDPEPTEFAGSSFSGATFPGEIAGVVPAIAAFGMAGDMRTLSAEDESAGLPQIEDAEEGGTVLLVSKQDVLSGDADLALQALEEESLMPVEVVIVPDTPVREPIRPMQPYSQYRQVD